VEGSSGMEVGREGWDLVETLGYDGVKFGRVADGI
jgi:hypothetical protein